MLGFQSSSETEAYDGDEGVLHIPLKFDMPIAEWRAITRADLIFDRVPHVDVSYEVRVYLNNKSANLDTPRTRSEGYAGRFVVFGHGNCFGETGHCDASATVFRGAISSATPLSHPAAPHRRMLTVTETLGGVLKRYKRGLHTVTLLTTTKAPRREDSRLKSGLIRGCRLSLQLYR